MGMIICDNCVGLRGWIINKWQQTHSHQRRACNSHVASQAAAPAFPLEPFRSRQLPGRRFLVSRAAPLARALVALWFQAGRLLIGRQSWAGFLPVSCLMITNLSAQRRPSQPVVRAGRLQVCARAASALLALARLFARSLARLLAADETRCQLRAASNLLTWPTQSFGLCGPIASGRESLVLRASLRQLSLARRARPSDDDQRRPMSETSAGASISRRQREHADAERDSQRGHLTLPKTMGQLGVAQHFRVLHLLLRLPLRPPLALPPSRAPLANNSRRALYCGRLAGLLGKHAADFVRPHERSFCQLVARRINHRVRHAVGPNCYFSRPPAAALNSQLRKLAPAPAQKLPRLSKINPDR